MFWDNVEISVSAGDGGNGLVSFRRARGEAKGGPDGGDGGNGGSVIIVADGGVSTLAAFARKKEFAAKSGQPGGKSRKHGKSAPDLELKVPVGTIVYEAVAGSAASGRATMTPGSRHCAPAGRSLPTAAARRWPWRSVSFAIRVARGAGPSAPMPMA